MEKICTYVGFLLFALLMFALFMVKLNVVLQDYKTRNPSTAFASRYHAWTNPGPTFQMPNVRMPTFQMPKLQLLKLQMPELNNLTPRWMKPEPKGMQMPDIGR